MKTKLIMLAVATSLLAVSAFAQKKPVFTSVYTTLNYRLCKVLKGGDGQDDAKLCPGVGGYKVREYSSATMTYIEAEIKGSDQNFGIASVSLAFNSNHSRIEWRLANGKPFAVIMRVPTYADHEDGTGPGKPIGEQLVVIGLKGQDGLNTSIDAKTRNANAKARAAADAGYKAP